MHITIAHRITHTNYPLMPVTHYQCIHSTLQQQCEKQYMLIIANALPYTNYITLAGPHSQPFAYVYITWAVLFA